MPAQEVWHHLTGVKIENHVENIENDTEWKSQDGKLRVFWFGEFNHADIFNSRGAERGIASMIRHRSIEENGAANPA